MIGDLLDFVVENGLKAVVALGIVAVVLVAGSAVALLWRCFVWVLLA